MILYHSCQTDIRASGSAVEHLLAKEGVAGSIPVSRSNRKGTIRKDSPFFVRPRDGIEKKLPGSISALAQIDSCKRSGSLFDSPSRAN